MFDLHNEVALYMDLKANHISPNKFVDSRITSNIDDMMKVAMADRTALYLNSVQGSKLEKIIYMAERSKLRVKSERVVAEWTWRRILDSR